MPFTLFKSYKITAKYPPRSPSLRPTFSNTTSTESISADSGTESDDEAEEGVINGLHVIQHFTQLQTLKLVSLVEAQKDDTIRMREESFVEEIRKQERAWERMRLSVRAKRAEKLADAH